jgi:hypothetical protein
VKKPESKSTEPARHADGIDKPKASGFRLKDGSVRGRGLQRELTWEQILEMCYEGRGGLS